MEHDTMYKAFHLLHRLGITANYGGYETAPDLKGYAICYARHRSGQL